MVSADESPDPGKQGHAEDGVALTAGWDGGFYIQSTDGSFEFRPLVEDNQVRTWTIGVS